MAINRAMVIRAALTRLVHGRAVGPLVLAKDDANCPRWAVHRYVQQALDD